MGSQAPNLIVAAVGGLSSHFIFDAIPHNDYLYYFYKPKRNPYTSIVSKTVLVTTGIYLLSVVIWMPNQKLMSSLIGSFFTFLPDALTGLWATLNLKLSPFDKFHILVHNHLTISEYIHNRLNPEDKINRSDEGPVNFKKMKKFKAVWFGWFLETSLELIILGWCLVKLWV